MTSVLAAPVIDFSLPADLEAHDPPEARGVPRDGVRMLVSQRSAGRVSHHGFRELPSLLLPGDLLVINTTGTLPAQIRAGRELAVHFSTPLPDGAWLVELRELKDKISYKNDQGVPGQVIGMPAGAELTLLDRAGAGSGGPGCRRPWCRTCSGTAFRSGTPTCRRTGRWAPIRRCSR